jgi:hypothetical protein
MWQAAAAAAAAAAQLVADAQPGATSQHRQGAAATCNARHTVPPMWPPPLLRAAAFVFAVAPCAAQTTPGTPPLSSGAAQLCSINSLFTRLTAIKADTHCRAGCQGGQCPPDWYPGVGDACNAECGAVFEPFWDECGAILVTSGMGGMSEMASFYDSCLHALYPPGSCGTFCNAHTYACYLAEVQASCCDEDGTNCVAGRDVPLACPVGCALVFPEFLETCRAHVNATFSLDILDFEAFEQSCLTQDGLQLVDYAMSLIAAGCTLDLSAHSSTDGHRRLQGHTSDGFLQNYVGSSSPGCRWDDIDDMAQNIDAICGGLTSTCSAQCAIATRQFTTTCGPTLAIILPAGDTRMASISAFETSCIQQADPAQFLHAMMAATCPANATNATTHGPSVIIDHGPPPPSAPAATYTIDVYASTAAPLVVGTTSFSVAGYTTYRLRKSLSPSQLNVYSIYGDAQNIPHVPPAWFAPSATSVKRPPSWNQVTGAGATLAQSSMMYTRCSPPSPQAAMCGPGTSMWPNINATYQNALLPTTQPLALTSFLSLGPDTYCVDPGCSPSVPTPSMSAVGTAITGWQNGAALTLGVNPGATTDFAFFWMTPAAPAAFQAANGVFVGGPLIAQLTLPSDQAWFVRLGLQGKSTGGADDWNVANAVWVHRSPSGACPAGMSGTGCLTDVDECASNPCANVAGSTGATNSSQVYSCPAGAAAPVAAAGGRQYCGSMVGECVGPSGSDLNRKFQNGGQISTEAACRAACDVEPTCTGYAYGVSGAFTGYCRVYGSGVAQTATSPWMFNIHSSTTIGGVDSNLNYKCVAVATRNHVDHPQPWCWHGVDEYACI